MDVLHPQKPPQSSPFSPSSRLNPNAPIFIPMKSYQMVEDFSNQWWELVHSSPFFRDYWLQDCFDDVHIDDDVDVDVDDAFVLNHDLDLLDFDDFFDQNLKKQEEKLVEEVREKEVISVAALKWSESGGRTMEAPRFFEKAPKIVKSVKVSPRTIHQPR